MFPLKTLSREAIPSALARAERYRLLNEPEEAESICEDVLRTDPENADALLMLILSLTDQFKHHDGAAAGRAEQLVSQIADPYGRAYYGGLVAERRARALLSREGLHAFGAAAEWLRTAMERFERAESLRQPGNDEALLRWNACARLASRHPQLLAPAQADERGEPLMLE